VGAGTGTVVHRSAKWYGHVSICCALSITGHLADGLSLAALIVDQSVVSLGSVGLDATTESGRGSYKAIGVKTHSIQRYFAGEQPLFASPRTFLWALKVWEVRASLIINSSVEATLLEQPKETALEAPSIHPLWPPTQVAYSYPLSLADFHNGSLIGILDVSPKVATLICGQPL
jgi:hypothetical protein